MCYSKDFIDQGGLVKKVNHMISVSIISFLGRGDSFLEYKTQYTSQKNTAPQIFFVFLLLSFSFQA